MPTTYLSNEIELFRLEAEIIKFKTIIKISFNLAIVIDITIAKTKTCFFEI